MIPRLPPLLLCALLAAALLPAACTAPAPVSPANLPDDFALGITVLPTIQPIHTDQDSDAPDPAPTNTTQSPAQEPAWYVLGPDDILHAATGERLPSSTMPLAVRILTREQVRHVWELVAAGGLATPNAPGTLVPESRVATPGASAIVFVAADGHRHSFAVLAGTPTAAAVSKVVMELRTLGWIPDPPQLPAPKPRPKAPADDAPNLSK